MPPQSISLPAKVEPPLLPTLRRFLPYLWPADAPQLKVRIVGAMTFVLLSKLLQVFVVAFTLKVAVDTMAAGDRSMGWFVVAVVCGYAAARFSTTLFDNLRNTIFEKVGQVATMRLAARVFRHLHNLSLRFHLERRTGAVTKVVERGTKSIDTMLYFLLFNIAPTVLELTLVLGPVRAVRLVAGRGDGGDGRGLHLVHAQDHRLAGASAGADERPRHRGGRACGGFAAEFRDGEIFRRRGARGAALRGRR